MPDKKRKSYVHTHNYLITTLLSMKDDTFIFIAVVILEFIAIFLAALTLFLYKKLKILRKPPGSLIFAQLIILFLLQIEDLIYFISFEYSFDHSYNSIAVYFYIYGYMSCVLYENCTCLEVLLRVSNSLICKNYKRRARLYHVLCNLLAIIYVLVIISFRDDNYSNGSINFEYEKSSR